MRRIVGEWNRLPLDITETSSVADVKLKVSTVKLIESLYTCIYIFFFLYIFISRFVGRLGRLGFPPRMVLWRFLGIISRLKTFSRNN